MNSFLILMKYNLLIFFVSNAFVCYLSNFCLRKIINLFLNILEC